MTIPNVTLGLRIARRAAGQGLRDDFFERLDGYVVDGLESYAVPSDLRFSQRASIRISQVSLVFKAHYVDGYPSGVTTQSDPIKISFLSIRVRSSNGAVSNIRVRYDPAFFVLSV